MGSAVWMRYGKCNTLTFTQANDIFFIGPGKSANKAREFCGACPVKIQCMNYALMYDERGIWAGTTEEERDSMDPWIKIRLREVARQEGTLEVRRVEQVTKVLPMHSSEDSALEALLQEVEQLEVHDLLYCESTVLEVYED